MPPENNPYWQAIGKILYDGEPIKNLTTAEILVPPVASEQQLIFGTFDEITAEMEIHITDKYQTVINKIFAVYLHFDKRKGYLLKSRNRRNFRRIHRRVRWLDEKCWIKVAEMLKYTGAENLVIISVVNRKLYEYYEVL